jgi:hypothetical protein
MTIADSCFTVRAQRPRRLSRALHTVTGCAKTYVVQFAVERLGGRPHPAAAPGRGVARSGRKHDRTS